MPNGHASSGQVERGLWHGYVVISGQRLSRGTPDRVLWVLGVLGSGRGTACGGAGAWGGIGGPVLHECFIEADYH
jgi:hypothetical protein